MSEWFKVMDSRLSLWLSMRCISFSSFLMRKWSVECFSINTCGCNIWLSSWVFVAGKGQISNRLIWVSGGGQVSCGLCRLHNVSKPLMPSSFNSLVMVANNASNNFWEHGIGRGELGCTSATCKTSHCFRDMASAITFMVMYYVPPMYITISSNRLDILVISGMHF